jgi:hypothetical protein
MLVKCNTKHTWTAAVNVKRKAETPKIIREKQSNHVDNVVIDFIEKLRR